MRPLLFALLLTLHLWAAAADQAHRLA